METRVYALAIIGQFFQMVFFFLKHLLSRSTLTRMGLVNESSLMLKFFPVAKYVMPGIVVDQTDLDHPREIAANRLFSSLSDKKVVIEVGAETGNQTLAVAKRAKRIIAVEPDSHNFRKLVQRTMKFSNVTCVNVALLDFNGFIRLYGEIHGEGSAIYRSSNFVTVRSATLDSVLADLHVRHVDLIKIDTEGAEVNVLKGGTDTIRKNFHVKFIIEPHGTNRFAIIRFLLKNHFECVWITPSHLYSYRP
ncbi:MAG TPA: FkbM family methyltransferase [Candidatus Acidoferrum sp.]|nr:FkbM family methyltransferase [Candidatus Acidoferrum sp.]